MDHHDCMKALMGAGITWAVASKLFYDQLARRADSKRREIVEHLVELAREDAVMRSA